jgi:hypothetical protein
MSLREAAQQALEALKMIDNAMPFPVAKHAIKQLSDALAEPETEAETYKRLYELRGKALERPCFHCGYKPKKIYPMEQRTEPEQEPLTDEEIDLLAVKHAPPIDPAFAQHDDFIEFARAIERAHGIGGEA